MTRYLKVLGLTMATTFAFAAFASAASAVEHHITGKKGEQLTVHSNNLRIWELTTGSGEGYECQKVGLEGKLAADTNETVTAELKSEECKAFEEGKTTTMKVLFATNGCHYTFSGLTTEGNPTGGEHANFEINCPSGNAIEILVTAFQFKCATVSPQLVEHAVRYVDRPEVTKGAIEIKMTAHGVESQTHGVCGEEKHTNGSYTGDVIVDTANGVQLQTT